MSNWMIQANKLDEEQKQFIFENVKSKENIWIQGFAGSGKSILLVHTIVEKIKENPNASICVVVFTHSLIQMFKAGMQELAIPNTNVYLTTYHQFKKENYTFDYIFCDEVQDLPKSVLEDMKKRTQQLILAGDSNQSIYESDPSSKEPTVTASEIGNITNSNPYILTGIHRLTESIIKLIDKLLPSMKIFEAKKLKEGDDISVRLCNGTTEYKEVEYIISEADKAISATQSVVIILPTHADIIRFVNLLLNIKNKEQWALVMDKWGKKPDWFLLNRHLVNSGINMEYIGNGAGDLFNSVRLGKMIIMTYHSAKGLDFDNVFLPFVSSSLNIRNKTLFMVGMTRSKNNLYLTYSNTLHEYVLDFENECNKINIDDSLANDSNDSSVFDF